MGLRGFALSIALGGVAHAGESTLSFPRTPVANTEVRNYDCHAEQNLSVAYVATVDGDAFAYLAAEGRPHIFISVLAPVGTRYVSGPYVWSINGPNGTLTRVDDANAPPLLADCIVVAVPPAAPMQRLGTATH
jgi:membrane-bound inhibitor of C-type lysozyme